MAFKAGKTPLAGYPVQLGPKLLNVLDHTGPASYVQFATPNTGGETFTAGSGGLNMGGFEWLDSGAVDTTGQFICYSIPISGGYGNALSQWKLQYFSLVTATVGGQAQTQGTQVAAGTNLSTFSWRIAALCV